MPAIRSTFGNASYPPALAALMPDESRAELAAGQPRETMRAVLARFDFTEAVAPLKVRDAMMAAACHAGLWLAHHFLDESHAISQRIDNATGSFWHGIVHRREGDYSNACYWFRRAAGHPVEAPLRSESLAAARDLGVVEQSAWRWLAKPGPWDAEALVALVQDVVAGREPLAEPLCRNIAWLEWKLLMDYCFQLAVGKHA